MNPFVVAQIQSIVEDLRLLEVLVAAPLGLHSDIRMLRQSVPMPEAADLPHEEERRRRPGYRGLAGDRGGLALRTVEQAVASVAVLEAASAGADDPEATARAMVAAIAAARQVGGSG